MFEHGAGEAFAQEREGTLFMGLRVGSGESADLRAEHRIADAGDQRFVIGERSGHLQGVIGKGRCGFAQVALIEDAVAVVGGKGLAVGTAESAALVNEAVQAGYVGDALGADQLIGREVGFSCEHGFDDAARFGDVADDGEARAGLLFAGKFVVDAVDAHGESVIAHGDNVYALAWGESQLPVVFRYACEDVVRGELPSGAYAAVFNPDVGVGRGESDSGLGVLDEN